VLSPRELRQLVRLPDRRRRKGRRDAALLGVLAGGGLRLGEAVSLSFYELEIGPRLRLTFVTSKSRSERMRTITLPAWAAEPLRSWLACLTDSDWLFAGSRGNHLSVRAAEKIVSKYLRAVGRSDLHPHSLRHSFGSLVTRETRSLFVAQKLLGHADPRTTSQYYSAFEVSDADNAAEALSRVVGRTRKNLNK
jgi:site-specific recombinase XerD